MPSDTSPKNPKSQPESGENRDPRESDPVDAPGKRGEDKSKQTVENDNRPAKLQPPQCRFVCYEDNRGWAVAVAIEAGQDAQSVKQGNNELHAKDCRYILDELGAKVTVEFKGGHPPQSFQLLKEDKKEDQFVMFKMRKDDWNGEGRKVKTLSSGEYVVFAHKSCGKRIGAPSNEPEQCRYDDFTAHFFSVSENNEKDGFKNCPLPFSVKRFSLKGQRFPDDSDLGELFGDDAPQLDDAEEWWEVSSIMVGRENGGKVLAKFRPGEKTIAEVLDECSGWFFVRIYDANVDLLHSFPFRRAKGLKNIFVNNQPLGEVPPIVPTKNGHTETSIQFEGDLSARPADDSNGISNGICKVTEKENCFAVLPHPDNDGTKWVLGSGADCVEAEILLPRIWWKFIEEKEKEGDWQDTPIKMKRQAFRRAENEKIRIRFSFRIPEIVVGFGDFHSSNNPTFRTKLSKDRKTCEAELRLVYFADYSAIEKPLPKAIYLHVKLKVKDSDVVFSIVRILPDPPPPPIIEPEIGKGFSRLELERAKEELYQEGLIAAAKAAEEFETNKPVLYMRILFDDKIKIKIPFDPLRKFMQDKKNVEKLKAFFKKHFGKE